MNSNGVVYRCNKSCPIGKRCFILKTAAMLEEPITVWHKCVAKKEDIPVTIGGKPPPYCFEKMILLANKPQ